MLMFMLFLIHCCKSKEKSVQQEVVTPNLEQVLTSKEPPTYDEVMIEEEPPSYELAMKTKELPTYEEVIDANYIEILDVPALTHHETNIQRVLSADKYANGASDAYYTTRNDHINACETEKNNDRLNCKNHSKNDSIVLSVLF